MPLNTTEKTFYVKLMKLQDPAPDDPTVPGKNYFWVLGLAEDDLSITPADIAKAHFSKFREVSGIGNPQYMPDPKAKAQRCVNEAKRKLTTDADLQQHRKDLQSYRTDFLEKRAAGAKGVSHWKSYLDGEASKMGFPSAAARLEAVEEVIDRLGLNGGRLEWFLDVIWRKPLQVGRWSIPRWIWAVFIGVLLLGLVHTTAGVLAGLAAAVVGAGLAYKTKNRQLHFSWGASALAAGGVLAILSAFGIGGSIVPMETGESLKVSVSNPNLPGDAPAKALLATPLSCSVPVGNPAGANQLSPLMALDGKAETAWIASEAVSGDWIELEFGEVKPIDGIGLLNSGMSGVKPPAGGNVHKARLEFDSGPPVEIEFENQAGWQIKPFDVRPTSKLRLKVLSTYANTSESGKAQFAELWCYVGDAAIPKTSWAGAWETDWGEMTARQTGQWFFADFKDSGKKVVAKLYYDGRLLGSWSQPPTHQPPRDAGYIELKFDPASKSFQSRMRKGFSGGWQSGGLLSGELKSGS